MPQPSHNTARSARRHWDLVLKSSHDDEVLVDDNGLVNIALTKTGQTKKQELDLGTEPHC
uniref:Transposase n=1 Tax=Peronospora matthiolae TaxID=2874970 RepID=A0AAV1UT39_9STRA